MPDFEQKNQNYSAAGNVPPDDAWDVKTKIEFSEGKPIKNYPRITRELSSIPPDEIDSGAISRICHALCNISGGSNQGFYLFDSWLQQSKSYEMPASEQAWEYYRNWTKPGRRPNEHTIYDIAKRLKKDKPALEDGRVYAMKSRKVADIVSREWSWLWPFIVPKGCITTFAGDGGIGKTSVSWIVASLVTTGGHWPGNVDKAKIGDCYFIPGEDCPERSIKPSLEVMGADMSRIEVGDETFSFQPDENGEVTEDESEPFLLVKHAHIIRSLFANNRELIYLDIDPVTSFIDRGMKMNETQDVRTIFKLYEAIAKDFDVSIVFKTHRTKAQGRDLAQSILGSQAFVNASRHVLMVVDDPEDTDRHILFVEKSNIAPKRSFGLPYRLKPAGNNRVTVEWEPVHLGKGELAEILRYHNGTKKQAEPEPSKSKKEQAKALIKELLEKTDAEHRQSFKAMVEDAEDEGISSRTMRRAMDELKEAKEVDGQKESDGNYSYFLTGNGNPY